MVRYHLKKLRLSAVLVFGFAALLQAAFLRNVPVKVKQPDGTVLDCLASGDEYYNWLHDANGYTIIRSKETGYLVFADKVDGKLVPTPYVAGRTDLRVLEAIGLRKNLIDDRKPAEARLLAAQDVPVANTPQMGTINNLVVYIRFSDEAEFSETFIDATAAAFSSGTAGMNSMKNYFAEASYGQLTIDSTFYPNDPPTVFSYQDPNPRAYYQPFDATTNPDGYEENERTAREHTLLRDAINAISSQVPAELNIDADPGGGDGLVDNVCFIVKGGPTAWSTLLWPHQWALYSYHVTINHKRVYTYNFQLEEMLNVGVLCHEMFHSLGSPDLYHYDSSYSHLRPVWAWDLMENQTNPPQHMGAYMKWKYGAWISSIPEITASGTYSLSPLAQSSNNCYKIASPYSPTEFFLVEYRKKEGTFEGALPGQGLLVYRINPAYNGNADGPPDEVYIYRPNGTPSANGTPSSATFSSNAGRTAINDTTNPTSFLTDGSAGGLRIHSVGATNAAISFSVTLETIRVTSPDGGEEWNAGEGKTVTWTSSGTIGSVDIELSTNGGTDWTTLVDNTANDGTEPITVPPVSSTSCLIRVAEGVSGAIADTSDAAFSIISIIDSITVTAPNGGEAWAIGSSRSVTWTETGAIENVAIDYSIDGGENWIPAIASVANIGSWPWTVPGPASDSCLVRVADASNGAISDTSNALFSITTPSSSIHDLLATWNGYGVYDRNSDTGAWVRIEPTPAAQIIAGDLDGDGIDDLIGIWPNDPGIWVKFSSTGVWAMLDALKPEWMAVGDMNGDAREDLVCTWAAFGVYYRNSMSGAWVRIEPTPATQIAAGDLDGDAKADLIGMWAADPGIWVKFSSTNSWAMLDSLKPEWMAVGDMNGDSREDLVCTWTGYGVYYRDSLTGDWIRIEPTPATQITAGDLDGDGKADLIGMWAQDPGIWVKYSQMNSWAMLDALKPTWMATGMMRPAEGPAAAPSGEPTLKHETRQAIREPSRQLNLSPEGFDDLSSTGPGGANFEPDKAPASVRVTDPKWRPQIKPGPGEPGFLPRDEGQRRRNGTAGRPRAKKK